ncbi:ABC transporter substrate-binding protein [Haloechinothrix salitolerans]|uniref:ABC transporter substrate-binding protein n=2 Tax=Haloechinothrix salitolerans TaxID=926830 RepID=A0ABW2C0E4_9PSEU
MASAGFEFGLGDQKAQAEAVISDINSRGGVLGKKITPVYYDLSTGRAAQDPNGTQQEACTAWTEDRPVFAVVDVIPHLSRPLAASCLAKHKTPLIAMSPIVLRPRPVYARLAPYLYAPTQPAVERLVPKWMQRLKASGYFEGWDSSLGQPSSRPMGRVGIIVVREQWGSEVGDIVKNELSRYGLEGVIGEFSGSVTQYSAQAAQTVPRFRESGVSHVIDMSGQIGYFTQAAESQHYRPRYGLSSANRPYAGDNANQMRGSLAVGWLPAYDVSTADDPGTISEAQTRCRNIMRRAGQNTSDRGAFSSMLDTCDGFSFLVRAVRHGSLSASGLKSGAFSMGRMESAATFRIDLRGSSFDGAASLRDNSYRTSCNCWRYSSSKSFGF